MTLLYIDDIRNPPSDSYTVVRSSGEVINYCTKHGCPDYISFDHDLGGADTSMKFVHWLIDVDIEMEGMFIPSLFHFDVHSANPVGAENIHGILRGYLHFKDNERFAV